MHSSESSKDQYMQERKRTSRHSIIFKQKWEVLEPKINKKTAAVS